MREVWKDIPGYENIYQASSFGNIRIKYYRKTGLPKLKAQIIDKDGYCIVCLTKNGKQKSCRVNRLIAKTFLSSFSPTLQVNHKDENKQNNSIENLECISAIDNMNWGTRTARMKDKKKNQKSVRILQFSLSGELIKEWISSMEIQRAFGYDRSAILRCCKNKQETSYGYKWKYA